MTMRTRCRRYFHWLHQHLGLWAGALFILLGATGSLITFYPEIDSCLNPNTKPATTRVGEISVQKVYEVLRKEYPYRTGSWRIELPMGAHSAIAARYYTPVETAHKKFAPIMVTMDPMSYQITSSRYWGRYLATWLYDLHYTLLSDELGHNAVGLIGILMLISILLGFWLWLPKWGRITRNMIPVIRSQRIKRVYDLHVISGVYGGLLISIIALTGVVLTYPHASKQAASALIEFDHPMPTARNLLIKGQSQANLDLLIDRSRSVFPRSEVRWVETSGEDGREVTLRLSNGNEPSRRFPQSYLKFHPASGELLYQRNYHQLPAGDRLWAWVHPLHNGEAFGLFGRAITAMLGLLPLALVGTGIVRYLHKVKARALARSQCRH